MQEVAWVQAHQQVPAEETEEQKRHREANDIVDRLAKMGAALRPKGTEAAQVMLNWHESVVLTLFALAGEVLPLFPREEPLQRVVAASPKHGQQPWQHRRGHRWAPFGARWKCRRCAEVTIGKEAAVQHPRCKGVSRAAAAEQDAKGHHLVRVVAVASTYLVCSRFGATHGMWSRLLRDECPGQARRGGVVALKRLASGRHPYQRSVEQVLAVVPLSVGVPPDGWSWDGRLTAEEADGECHRLSRVLERAQSFFEPAAADAAWM